MSCCITCSLSIHIGCDAHLKASDDYKCKRCISSTSPVCSLCEESVADIKTFRCIRCDHVSHFECQSLIRMPKELNRSSKCDFCLLFDIELQAIFSHVLKKMPNDNLPSHASKYLVKFLGSSALHARWVPNTWLENLKDFRPKLRSFIKKGNDKGEYHDPVFSLNYITAQSILNVEIDGDVSKLQLIETDLSYILAHRLVGKVLVKWKPYSYNEVTWEAFPYSVEDLAPYSVIIDYLAAISKTPRSDIENLLLESFKSALKSYISRQVTTLQYSTESANSKRRNFSPLAVQPSYLVNGELKDYQLDGLNWLLFKWSTRIPSVLADEMGLGKTIQIAAMFSVLKNRHVTWPFLVIAPTSLLVNWKNELKKWAPDLHSVIYVGDKTERELILESLIYPDSEYTNNKSAIRCHVVFTNYEAIMNEGQVFKQIKWEVLVCDEGHRLKNDEAKTFNALAAVNAVHKIVLTGTPLQNNIKELFSLLKFMDPSKFENSEKFVKQFEVLTDQNVVELHNILIPHFLRRTKALVLKGLPPKAEILVPVSLTSLQQELYKAVIQKNFDVLKTLGTGVPAKISNLQNVMMELRKICGHPYLIGPEIEPENLKETDSHQALVDACGKLKLLQVMLPKLKARGSRVLIFSQFKLVLDILEDFLNGETLKFCRLVDFNFLIFIRMVTLLQAVGKI